MIPTISATALSRRYRDQIALDEVSLTVEPGTVTGLLGRNGAGKTTLMRIITGQEFPTSGAVRVFGQVPAENDAVLGLMVLPELERGTGPATAGRLRPSPGAADQEAVARNALRRRDHHRAGGPRRADPVRRALRGTGRGGTSAVLRPAAG